MLQKFGVQCTTTILHIMCTTQQILFFYHVVEYKSEGGKDILSRILLGSFWGRTKKIPSRIGSTQMHGNSIPCTGFF